tara:strand:+ start:1372 stop:2178 length:807 start_codon:yes stop_codon:yes gene_type:complete
MFFIKEYKCKKIKEPDIYLSRKKIFQSQDKNLLYLINSRFLWMKKFIKNKKIIIELGSGNGCVKKVLKNKKIILTDIVKYKWIDKKVDMINLDLDKKLVNKVDVFIINHSLHHSANPALSIQNMSKFLKKDGLILLNEPETSFMLKLIQMLLDDESWSLKANVFNKKKKIFKSSNPWVSNTAIAQLLFKDKKKFEKKFPQYAIEKNQLSEFLIFLNSGGLSSNFFHFKLNNFFLKIVDSIDKILIYLFPSIFALNRSVVLRKKNYKFF